MIRSRVMYPNSPRTPCQRDGGDRLGSGTGISAATGAEASGAPALRRAFASQTPLGIDLLVDHGSATILAAAILPTDSPTAPR